MQKTHSSMRGCYLVLLAHATLMHGTSKWIGVSSTRMQEKINFYELKLSTRLR